MLSLKQVVFLFVACLTFCDARAAAQQLWVVDDDAGPGVDFADLQPAIDAAASGDTLLIRDGDYGSFNMVGKGLSLVADGADVRCGSGFINLVLLDPFVLRGLQFSGSLSVAQCVASGWIEDCAVKQARLTVRANDSLVIASCQVQAGEGSPALRVENSIDQEVYVYDSALVGGSGQSTPFGGGPGAQLDGGRLILVGSSVDGGLGGSPSASCPGPPPGPNGGPAGDGLVVNDGRAYLLDTQPLAGPTGPQGPPPPQGCQPPPPPIPGADVDLNGSGALTAWSSPAASLAGPAVLREGALGTFTLQAQAPGADVFLFVDTRQAHRFLPGLVGGLFLPLGTLVVLPQAPMPGSGVVDFAFQAPSLPVGSQGLRLHVQAGLGTPGGDVLSAPTTVLVVDSSL